MSAVIWIRWSLELTIEGAVACAAARYEAGAAGGKRKNGTFLE